MVMVTMRIVFRIQPVRQLAEDVVDRNCDLYLRRDILHHDLLILQFIFAQQNDDFGLLAIRRFELGFE